MIVVLTRPRAPYLRHPEARNWELRWWRFWIVVGEAALSSSRHGPLRAASAVQAVAFARTG